MDFKEMASTRFYVSPQFEFLHEGNEYDGIKGEIVLSEGDIKLYKSLTGDKKPIFSTLNEKGFNFHSVPGVFQPKYARIPWKEIRRIQSIEGDKHYHDPLIKFNNLYAEMNKIDFFDRESLEKFIKEFGLPMGKDVHQVDAYSVFHREMDVFIFYEHLKLFKIAFSIYEAIKFGYNETIEKYSRDYDEFVSNCDRKIKEYSL